MVVIRGKKHSFNIDVVSKLSESEFKEHCSLLPIFIQLPEKERNSKIKEAYGNLTANAKESGKSGKQSSGRNLRDSDAEPIGRDTGAKQGSDDGRENVNGKKDKSKVRKQELPEQNDE